LADPPRGEEVAPVGLGRGATDRAHSLAVVDVGVAVLDEQAAQDAAVVALARVASSALAVEEDPGARLRPELRERGLLVAGREQHLDEGLRQPLGELAADRTVEDGCAT